MLRSPGSGTVLPSVSTGDGIEPEKESSPLPSFDLTPPPKPSGERSSSSSPTPPVPPPPPRSKPPSSRPPPPAPGPIVSQSQSAIPAPTPVPQNPEDERVVAGFERLTAYVNARSQGLPSSLRTRLQSLPKAKLGVAAGGALLVIVGAVFAFRSGPSTPALESGVGDQSAAQIPATQAVAATSAPSPTMPSGSDAKPVATPTNEASILLAQADKLLEAGRHAEVLPLIDRLIARQPELKNDARLAAVLLKTAASTDAKAAADTFALLKGPMGEAGAALAYELSLSNDVNAATKKRVEAWLRSKEFERTSSLQVYTAVKLRSAKSCEDKHSLLELAGNTGGKYVLDYLHELDKKSVCSPDALDDCFSCMKNDGKLKLAIEKVEAQLKP